MTTSALSVQERLSLLELPSEGYMRLFIRIQGLSPVQMHQRKGLSIKSYIAIANQYYSDLYGGEPPEPLYPHKIVSFKNGDRLLEFRRKETLALKFCIDIQEKIHIYDEPPPCKESIVMTPSPVPDICEYQLPKIISLNRLILKITDSWSDGFLLRVFWHTYRSFTKPRIVLLKLFERFDVPPLANSPDQQRKSTDRSAEFLNSLSGGNKHQFSYIDEAFYNIEIKRKIQEKVGRLLLYWINNYYFDFDDRMVREVEKFCDNRLRPSGYLGIAREIREALKNNSREPYWRRETNEVKTITITQENINILETPDQDFADTLTFMDHLRYKAVKFTEMLDQSWNKDKKRHMAPNIMSNINFLNTVSNWVSYNILSEENLTIRTKLIKKFIKLLVVLSKQNSYNMLLAVHSGMSNAAVHRLTNTWSQIKEKYNTLRRKTIEVITSSTNNYKLLRDHMNKVYEDGEPCSPYMGLYLKDLVFTDDGNPTYVDGKINMFKFLFMYNSMFQILRFQARDYDNILPNENVMRELESFQKVDDATLFAMSLKIQPKLTP